MPEPTSADLSALDTDPAYLAWLLRLLKKRKRDAINAECERRILARWPEKIQMSINAGLYPSLVAPMQADISTIVAESNAARDVVFALTDIDLVRSYDPAADPGWADIGTYQQQEPV
jgi:hypothetical protein